LTDNVKQQSSSSGYGDILSSVLGGSSDNKNSSGSNSAVDKAKDALGDLFNK
jgi:hypothetical protein